MSKSEALFNILQHSDFFCYGAVGFVPSFNHQSGGSPFVSSPRLLIIHIIYSQLSAIFGGMPYTDTIYWHQHKYHEKYKMAFIYVWSCHYIQCYLYTFSISVTVINNTGNRHWP